MTEIEGKWGYLKGASIFYWIISKFPNCNFLIEFIVSMHIYILAFNLSLRERYFDSWRDVYGLQNEAVKSERWCYARRAKNSEKRKKRKVLVIGGDGTIGSEVVRLYKLRSDFDIHIVTHQNTENAPRGENIVNYTVDFLDKEQILMLASRLRGQEFDFAVFAAGIMLFPEFRTQDGVETHNAINVVGQLMLYELLHHEIRRAVFLSSATARKACFPTNRDFLGEYAGPFQAYSSSKLYLAVYVHEMVRRRNVSAITMHPGTVPGRLYRYANPFVQALNGKCLPGVMRSPKMAAALVVHTVCRRDMVDGGYYEDTEIVELVQQVPENIRHMIYDTIHQRIEMWMRR